MPAPRHDSQWPRPYLLQIYGKALAEGCCLVELADEAKARSLIAAFYRLRRRGDSAHKQGMILPEYHLVMAQRVPAGIMFIYDALPDGLELPAIRSVPESQRSEQPAVSPAPDIDPDDGLADDEIAGIIDSLADEALHRPPE